MGGRVKAISLYIIILVALTDTSVDWKPGQKLMMKYKYNGNAASPIGKELTVSRQANVTFVQRHDKLWIKVRNEHGEEGFVPDGYVMVRYFLKENSYPAGSFKYNDRQFNRHDFLIKFSHII